MLTRSTFAASCRAALLFAALAGCSDDKPEDKTSSDEPSQTDFEVDEAQLKAVLRNPIQSCQQLVQCGIDAGSREQCNAHLKECLTEVVTRAQRVLAALEDCRQTALQCVESDAGRSQCKADFKVCAKAAFESWDASDAGSDAGIDDADDVDEDVDAGSGGDVIEDGLDTDGGVSTEGSDDSSASDESVPSIDAGVGGGRRGRPGSGRTPGLPGAGGSSGALPGSSECIEKLRTCVSADRSAARQCAEEAQACIADQS